MTKSEQLSWSKPRRRRKHSPKVRWDIKLVGKNGSAGIWSTLVKLNAGMKCEVCGTTTSLNAHHIEGRRNEATRYDLRNGVCLCAYHHVFGKESAHQSPIWFEEWLKEHRNADLYYIKTKRIETKSWYASELEDLYNDYVILEQQLNDKSN